MNPLLDDRLLKIVELLKCKFELTKNVRPKLKDSSKIKVFIMLRDIESLAIHHQDVHLLLDQLAQSISGVEIRDVFDYDNFALGVMEHHKEIAGYELPFATVLLPDNFIELLHASKESKNNHTQELEKMEILEDETESKKITVYINTDYEKERSYKRGDNWKLMYELAENQTVEYKRGFFDYFNSNIKNPLYSKKEFKLTRVLKKDGDYIIPNIEIKIITQQAVSRRRKKA